VQTQGGGLTYYWILGGSCIGSWLAFRSVLSGDNPNKREMTSRKAFQRLVHLGGQNNVRTFSESIVDEIEIPIYDISLRQQVRAR